MKSRANQGFTLVEMLVVIAIIAILAGALFPAITGAMESARATAMKNKGRAIWVAITASNTDREVLGECLLWPKDLEDENISGLTLNKPVDYFTYLMSDNSTFGAIAKSPGEQIVGDLKRDSFAGAGVTHIANSTTIADKEDAWSVFVIGSGTDAVDALFITRNAILGTSLDRPTTSDDKTSIKLDPKVKPFGNSRAVWVSFGGGLLDARKIYLTSSRLFAAPSSSDGSGGASEPIKVLPNDNGGKTE